MLCTYFNIYTGTEVLIQIGCFKRKHFPTPRISLRYYCLKDSVSSMTTVQSKKQPLESQFNTESTRKRQVNPWLYELAGCVTYWSRRKGYAGIMLFLTNFHSIPTGKGKHITEEPTASPESDCPSFYISFSHSLSSPSLPPSSAVFFIFCSVEFCNNPVFPHSFTHHSFCPLG